MKDLKSVWFTQGNVCIGVVRGTNGFGEEKAYIGVGLGLNKKQDEIYIAESGAPFLIQAAKLLIP
jgi:hypothetical protein